MTAAGMLTAAAADIGYVETPVNRQKFGAWYQWDGVPWCDMAIAYWAAKAGELDAVGKFASTRAHAAWLKKQGRLVDDPRPGDLVFYAWSGGGMAGINHVGVVERILPGGYMNTIEGNTSNGTSLVARRNGGGVLRMKRSRTAYVACYARPAYAKPAGLPVPAWYRRELRQGMRGADVVAVQLRLRKYGWKGAADGDYGPATRARVQLVQRNHQLAADGVVGPLTARVIG